MAPPPSRGPGAPQGVADSGVPHPNPNANPNPNPNPNPNWKVSQIVECLTRDTNGVASEAEVSDIFVRLLGIPQDKVAGAHHELLDFAMLDDDPMIDKIMNTTTKAALPLSLALNLTLPLILTLILTLTLTLTTKAALDRYYAIEFPNLLEPIPDKNKVKRIVQVFRTNPNPDPRGGGHGRCHLCGHQQRTGA